MSYANKTTVSIENSQMEAQKLLQKYGAAKFAIDWQKNQILFELKGRSARIQIRLPEKKAFEYTPKHLKRQLAQVDAVYDQACRQRWRALVLVLKAKLEAIESGITTLDNEFMPYFILQNGMTLADYVIPQLSQPDLLPQLPME
jgi:hypothetical protein